MKPIYFPFTYVSGPVAAALAACFKQTIVYQPSRHSISPEIQMFADSKIIDLRIPISGDENKFETILNDYNTWANLHQKGVLDFFKAWEGKVPFFDETFSSQIRADILEQNSAGQGMKASEDIFNARLFLHIAQDFDLQNNGLIQDLKLFETMEQDLYRNLKGEDETLNLEAETKEKLPMSEPGFYMAEERLQAWAKLMQHDKQPPGLFITTSRPVLEEIMDKAPEIEKVVDLDPIPIHARRDETVSKWQDDLFASLKTLLTRSWPLSTDGMFKERQVSKSDAKIALKLYIAAGETSHDFFARFVGKNFPQAELAAESLLFKNTLIGIIEI